ncbi:MAG: Ku protein [Chloroflexi bacterium]|nr:Ku protein [Chloroflexota bacterium]
MSRAFWKGAISFGMVVIPVRMYVATESKTPALHFLHKKCLTPPKQQLYCQQDNEYFSVKDTVKGFEYGKGQYVVLDEADLKKVPIKTVHAIEIQAFVTEAEIDPAYYYGLHYLEPEELGARPFSLLREVLVKSRRVGVAKVAFQRREHLCCLRPRGDILALHTMRYSNEILPHGGLAAPGHKASARELEMASTLVNAMTRSFKPEEYRDEYGAALQTVIQAKLQGEEIKAPKVPRAEAIDLMSALKASIEQVLKESEGKTEKRERAGARK